MSPAAAILRAVRPRQWVKNLFVAAPLVFAKKLTDPATAGASAAAVAVFCALSSAVYLVNDVVDRDKDRAHPTKQHRPIAAGHLAPGTALVLAAALAAGALAGAYLLAPPFALVSAGYLVINLAYSLALKEIVFLDVAMIATGFLLRVLGGAYAISVPASPWLLACTGLLAALLGFGKRAHEIGQARRAGRVLGETRGVLGRYSPAQLRIALWLLAGTTTVAYVLYTQAAHTVAFFGTRELIWTAPFCALGIGRFLMLVTRHDEGDSPTDAILRDAPFMANLALWGLAVLFIIYVR